MQDLIHLWWIFALRWISENSALILRGVDEAVTVGLVLRWHIPWCFILGRRAAISQQKTALNSDPAQDGPINTSGPGDGQTQKL